MQSGMDGCERLLAACRNAGDFSATANRVIGDHPEQV